MPDIRRGTVRAALQSRDFRAMFIGSFLSNIGTWMQNVVLPAYIYNRTGRASLVGIFIFAQLGPLLLLSIPAGVVADKFDRRRWLMFTQTVQMTFSFLLFPLAAADAPVALLFLAQLGVGIGNSLNAPAWSATLPSLVPPEDLPGAISLNSTIINGSRVIGPIIVALLANFGVSTSQVFLINSVTYLFVIFAVSRVTIPAIKPAGADQGWKQLMTGIRIARERPVVSRLLLSLATFSFLSLPYVGLFPAVARLNFGIDETGSTYRWLYATWGLGAALGGLAIGTVLVDVDKRRIIRWGFASFAVFIALFGLANTPLLAFLVAFPLGIAYFGTTTSMMTVLQSRLAPNERGRVMALWFMAFGGTVPLGNLLFGPVIDAIGARWVLVGGAVWSLVLAWWCDVRAIEGTPNDTPGLVIEPDDA